MRTIILSLSLLFVSLLGQSQCINGLVPKPVQILSNNQEFIINQKTTLIIDDGVDKNFRSLFNEKFSPAMGFDLLAKSSLKKNIQKNYIRFKLTDDVSLGREGYKLKVTSDGIDVVAGGYGGCYYALETLRQLLPASIYGQSKVADMKWSVPGVEITDYPRFGWRGMMLDVSRIFSDLEYVKKYIDWLAAHKLNIFHWHLTDDQGWRIEIKKYPKLTEIGAWRGEGEVLRAYCSVGTGRYGGFYTQDQIKEVIAYAAVRNVEIIPEIDMPGHSRAATASYPEIFCNSKEQLSGAQGQIQNVWCAGCEANYEMLKDIIDEITALFPSKYIHIGGDEVNKSYWKNCTHCQELMKKEGLSNETQLQSWFIRRVEKMVIDNGKFMIGWSEAINGGELHPSSTIMSWINEESGVKAAKKGMTAIMAPGQYCYFDMPPAPGEPGHFWAGVVPIERVYSFDPLNAKYDFTPQESKRILGVQGAIWFGPYVDVHAYTTPYTYPRLSALAEVAWTPQQSRSWNDFNGRLINYHYERLYNMGIDFRVPPPTAIVENGMVKVTPPYEGAKVRFTEDGSTPNAKSSEYVKPFVLKDFDGLRFSAFYRDVLMSPVKTALRGSACEWKVEPTAAGSFETKSDITATMNKSGVWYATIHAQKDVHDITFTTIEVLENGEIIVQADISVKLDSGGKIRIPVEKVVTGRKYEIMLKGKSPLGISGKGKLILSRNEYMEPEIIFSTNTEPASDKEYARVTDHNYASRYSSKFPGKKGDYFLFEFKTPVTFNELRVETGETMASRYMVMDGYVEISYDGKTFSKASDFVDGIVNLPATKNMKALRIVVSNDHFDPKLMIGDLKLR